MTLREARELVTATQQQIADLAGCTKQAISGIERGENTSPSHELVVRIVRALQQRGLVGLRADQIAEFAVPPVDATTDGAQETRR